MKRYTIASVLLALAALILFAHPQQFSESGGAIGQKRPTRKPATAAPGGAGAKDYSKFSHSTREHSEGCKTCHKVPTDNWQKVRDFPDVADFPGHDACVRCHRAQFFKGAQPVICSVCHTKTSPRDGTRATFRNTSRPRQFTILFPHDKHQDVIASLPSRPGVLFRGPSLVRSAHAFADTPQPYNNCEICHAAPKPPVTPATGWPDKFVPAADTFKASPTGHASCFNCHWSGQEPTKDKCEKCHDKTATPYFPVTSPKRISIKFRHDGGGEKKNHQRECTSCHINITKSAKLEALKPDVPIFPSCMNSDCHNHKEQLDDETTKFNKPPPGGAPCTKCHTSDVGGRKPPASHAQALVGQ
jgi:hypothetical protein